MNLQPIEGPRPTWKADEKDTTETTRLALAETEPGSIREGRGNPTREKIIGDKNNLRPIVFLETGIRLSRAVAHITVPNRGVATGFLIGPDLLMTNNHVFATADEARDAVVRFNYQRDLQGNMLPTDEYGCDPGDLFWTSPENELDCTVVRVQGDPGMKWGFLAVPPAVHLRPDDDVVIIQHPAGEPKQIGLTDNEVAYVDGQVAQYLTDTLPGSSGSPVFDDNWALVALHHSGGWLPEPNRQSTHYRNEGIVISAIREALVAGGVLPATP